MTLSAFSEDRTNTIVPTYVVNDAAKNRDGAKTECRFRYTTKLGTPELAFASPFYVPTCVTQKLPTANRVADKIQIGPRK